MLFPDGITERNAPPFGAGLGLRPWGVDPELQWAGARAHNRWIAEFCQMEPIRRIGLAIVPMLYDVEQAVNEVEWAHGNGLRGILIPALHKRNVSLMPMASSTGFSLGFLRRF